MFSAISSQPTAPIYTEDGEYFDGFLNTKANPVAIVDLLDKATLKSRFVGSAYIEIEPIKELEIAFRQRWRACLLQSKYLRGRTYGTTLYGWRPCQCNVE